ncbi:hypothetical protein [Curtobacterium sp. 20TX0008]|uniref:hypothetical protein n=1 Tax=Curtobacterium sp. 20TX0008 TaxID=3022018 RepID=UPI0023313746|nr:hypothetical protein [Curtobacterium sp. 20TX0008]MDB6427099.1 hypothetical protein [Curtobacterium sp. 20TX0008]
MSTQIALVCDDRADRLHTWATKLEERLGDGWRVEEITGTELALLVDALSEAERPHREAGHPDANLTSDQSAMLRRVDDAGLLVLDSDLTPSRSDMDAIADGEDITRALRNQSGETLARQARALTTVGYIIVVNRYYGSRFFDLTMNLFETGAADLYITNDDIGDAALWTGTADGARFNPSYWPVLGARLDAIDRAVTVVEDLDAKVFDTLGIDPDLLEPEQLDVLQHVDDPHDATFRQLVDSPLGLRFPDAPVGEDAVRRVAASVLLRWLVRTVCSPQNVVSDLPHLLTRFPQLFGDDVAERGFWDAAAVKGAEAAVDVRFLDAARSPVSQLVGRPFYDLEAVRSLGPRQRTSTGPAVRLVYAEDTSRFVDPSEADGFRSALPGSAARRFVESLDRRGDEEVEYRPRTRRR